MARKRLKSVCNDSYSVTVAQINWPNGQGYTVRVLRSKLLVAFSLLPLPCAVAEDQKHKQPMVRHAKEKFVAFAYTASGNLTAEGTQPVAGKTIAADPKLLPMGSRVRIDGAGPYSGEYRVGDVGSKIKGNKVDIFVRSRDEAIQFGRRSVLLTVLEVAPIRVASAESTRTRKAETTASQNCKRCDDNEHGAIIALDEAGGSSSTDPARGARASGAVGDGPRRGDSRQTGGSAVVVSLPDSEGSPLN